MLGKLAKTLAILAFGWGFVLAQGADAVPTDISQWFASTASLAAVVAALVSLLRKHVLKTIDGLPVLGLSLALSLLLAFVGHKLGYLGADWLAFGFGAFAIASGGTAYLKSLGSGGSGGGDAQAPGDTRTDAGRARLR